MSDCLFCKILAGEIPSDKVYEDDKVYVFKDIYPKADVHLLMIPREHVDSLNKIDESFDSFYYYYYYYIIPKLAACHRRTPKIVANCQTGFRKEHKKTDVVCWKC